MVFFNLHKTNIKNRLISWANMWFFYKQLHKCFLELLVNIYVSKVQDYSVSNKFVQNNAIFKEVTFPSL